MIGKNLTTKEGRVTSISVIISKLKNIKTSICISEYEEALEELEEVIEKLEELESKEKV